SQPIVIGAYGNGALPKIHNRPEDLHDRWHTNVDVQGSYLIIEYIETTILSPPVDPGCANTPVGNYVGFNFRNPNNVPNGASYNLMRFVKASYHTIGASLHANTHHNRILNSTFANNNVMHVLTPATNAASYEDPGDDIGAWGILLSGRNHEVA